MMLWHTHAPEELSLQQEHPPKGHLCFVLFFNSLKRHFCAFVDVPIPTAALTGTIFLMLELPSSPAILFFNFLIFSTNKRLSKCVSIARGQRLGASQLLGKAVDFERTT